MKWVACPIWNYVARSTGLKVFVSITQDCASLTLGYYLAVCYADFRIFITDHVLRFTYNVLPTTSTDNVR